MRPRLSAEAGPLDEPRGHNPSEDLDLKYNKTNKYKYNKIPNYILLLLLEIATILK